VRVTRGGSRRRAGTVPCLRSNPVPHFCGAFRPSAGTHACSIRRLAGDFIPAAATVCACRSPTSECSQCSALRSLRLSECVWAGVRAAYAAQPGALPLGLRLQCRMREDEDRILTHCVYRCRSLWVRWLPLHSARTGAAGLIVPSSPSPTRSHSAVFTESSSSDSPSHSCSDQVCSLATTLWLVLK
jgi:hypothetical protein